MQAMLVSWLASKNSGQGVEVGSQEVQGTRGFRERWESPLVGPPYSLSGEEGSQAPQQVTKVREEGVWECRTWDGRKVGVLWNLGRSWMDSEERQGGIPTGAGQLGRIQPWDASLVVQDVHMPP